MARYGVNGFPGDPFLRVPLAFIDLHMADFSGNEVLIILYILRRTVGFHKETDHISLQQFSKGIRRVDGSVLDRGTGIPVRTVARVLADLEARGVLQRFRGVRKSTGASVPTRITLNWPLVVGPQDTGG